MKKTNRLGVFLSLILRHKPEVIGISLDRHGWANVSDLIMGINNTGRYIDKEILEHIVATDEKQRYSFNEDKTLIRANQGHSIPVDVELQECVPPEFLYHGTSENSINAILEQGLKSMNRLHVHLSTDIDTALKIGKRHGIPVLLKVNTKAMHQDGYKFYLSTNGVWLTKEVDPKYISLREDTNE